MSVLFTVQYEQYMNSTLVARKYTSITRDANRGRFESGFESPRDSRVEEIMGAEEARFINIFFIKKN